MLSVLLAALFLIYWLKRYIIYIFGKVLTLFSKLIDISKWPTLLQCDLQNICVSMISYMCVYISVYMYISYTCVHIYVYM